MLRGKRREQVGTKSAGEAVVRAVVVQNASQAVQVMSDADMESVANPVSAAAIAIAEGGTKIQSEARRPYALSTVTFDQELIDGG